MKKYFICCFIFLISCSSAQNEDMIIVEDSSSVTVTTTVPELTFENDHDEEGHDEDISKGIVKFLVDIYDETEETVGIATILTMVKKIDQN